MAGPIHFYFDFASPYAYCAAGEVEKIGAEFGRAIEWRPILLWAVLKAHGIAPPMDSPVKRAYFLNDMQRSAAFFGLAYRQPAKLPLSSHLAARLFHATAKSEPRLAIALARRLLSAFFAEQKDISDEATVTALAAELGIPADAAADGMKGSLGRSLLESAVQEAVSAGAVGSPYFLVDGEGFFGADRLPQLRWFLGGGGR
ncbi:2-hydroxychromene-2-carboxylate isomerase [Pseudorhodoplanes sp.]|uniref:2-hydroxychromene-2-carboxylate isomerase n=1 Tax=Pseudorhodoplanes sp. TaxID=1934341 RepID=UPI002C27C588|nr:2-hydroxychromene-2-carboxylate isomerase [Pseudorhodoplanes sp.]HWK68897.1 2-hydroxychromene-2-carboxylate isomerase [Rhizobiaceae bacterium]HWV41026.1 2-hydroxychromene-2-carboxylate isomerase [Pseudorhodoplanes sp.]